MFQVEKSYTKQDIYQILEVPVKLQKGTWNTGYIRYKGNFFVFANIGIAGRTGHDYQNFWDGPFFHWEGKTGSKINQSVISGMINPPGDASIFLFTRQADRDPFVYEGKVRAVDVVDVSPVKVIWELCPEGNNVVDFVSNEQFYMEGKAISVAGNRYERNPLARRTCLNHYGARCMACNIDLAEQYGELARGLIHVHHLVPISEIGEAYLLDPVKDLVPLCPNCHAVVHRRNPPLSVEEIRGVLTGRKVIGKSYI